MARVAYQNSYERLLSDCIFKMAGAVHITASVSIKNHSLCFLKNTLVFVNAPTSQGTLGRNLNPHKHI